MINLRHIDENTVQFEDFAATSAGNKVGDHLEVPMGGPWTAKRFVICRRERLVSDNAKILLTARAIVSKSGYELDPVAGTVKHCGRVVARYVFDEACGLHYVGVDLECPDAPYFCAETAEAALQQFTA